MTHEFLKIIRAFKTPKKNGLKTVLATVVAKEGSSYRRPGVRMLIDQNNNLTGAVSGGCVEKEVIRQAASVFKTDEATIMTYDGRYRLGCEGVIYILIEPFAPSDECIQTFESVIRNRKAFKLKAYYELEQNTENKGFTHIEFESSKPCSVFKDTINLPTKNHKVFVQNLNAIMRLIIIGAEHDAVQLCLQASLMGWEVMVVASESDPRTLLNFPGASKVLNADATSFDPEIIDTQTAIVLMTHSFVKDLKYLHALKNASPLYLGLLGPSKRREKLLNAFIEHFPDTETGFFDTIHGPAGLHLGAETPQEIAISILAEILSVIRQTKPLYLKDKKGKIHSDLKW